MGDEVMTAEERRQRGVQRKLDKARMVPGMYYVVTEGPSGWYDVRHVASSAIVLTTESLHVAMEHASAITTALTAREAQDAERVLFTAALDAARIMLGDNIGNAMQEPRCRDCETILAGLGEVDVCKRCEAGRDDPDSGEDPHTPETRFVAYWAPMGYAVLDLDAAPSSDERVRYRGLERVDAERLRDCFNGIKPAGCAGCTQWGEGWGVLSCCTRLPAPGATT